MAANVQVETPSIATSITAEAAVILAGRVACNANCDDTGPSTTIGSSRANISIFLMCDRAMCNKPKTRAIRGGESLTPL